MGGGEIKDSFLRVVTIFSHPCQKPPWGNIQRSQMPSLQSSKTRSIPTSQLWPYSAKDDTVPMAATAAEQPFLSLWDGEHGKQVWTRLPAASRVTSRGTVLLGCEAAVSWTHWLSLDHLPSACDKGKEVWLLGRKHFLFPPNRLFLLPPQALCSSLQTHFAVFWTHYVLSCTPTLPLFKAYLILLYLSKFRSGYLL